MSATEQQQAPPAAAAEKAQEGGLSDVVLTKYKTAGEIAARAIKAVIALAKEGATVLELIQAGDKAVEEGTAGVYNNKAKVPKGSAFPTSVSVNHVICNYSPLPSDSASSTALKANDVVKIQIGAHIDGYAAVAAETVVVGASSASPVTGRAADVIKAAHTAAELAIRIMKPGATNLEVAKQLETVVKDFECRAVEGMQSNLMDKDVIDGKKKIVTNPDPSNKPDACKLEENEVYGVDIHVTTSADGKSKPDEARTTIYKKTTSTYLLKMATSRKIYSEIQKKAGAFPFNLRALEDEKRARMGVSECVTHGLLTPFEVLYDTDKGALTAQVFFTVAISSKGAIRLTPAPSWYSAETVKSDKEVKDDATKAILASAVRQTKKKNKTKKEGETAAPAAA